jgi:DMSO/TMAO reductase YedYZ molybdopterin-dependent catalytic subunit
MAESGVTRREVIKKGAAITGLSLFSFPWLAQAFQSQPGEEVLPWIDQPEENPYPEENPLTWEEVDSWITPNEQFFNVAHFSRPEIEAEGWTLELAGLVNHPRTFTLDELKARPRKGTTFTLECSGNHGLPFFWGGIGNAAWAGTSLASILEEAGVQDEGSEVVFYGRDAGDIEVRDIPMTQHFARSMSLEDAMSPHNLLVYEMNGEPLPQLNGFPVRLIAPGWYGIANVKWLDRIEVLPTRYMGHFMAREYVTIREEKRDGETVWTETSVGRTRLKSVPAKVTRAEAGQYRIMGAAWGAPIAHVEVQIDGGAWQPAQIDQGQGDEFTWKFWHVDWDDPALGEHDITSRAVDTEGNVQPAPTDPIIANKHTYWESNAQVTRRVRIS